MLRNYLKVAWRSLTSEKGYALIKVGSLALGLAAGLLIFAFVRQEWSYDRFHERADRLFRVTSTSEALNGGTKRDGRTPIPLADVLRERYPQVQHVARVHRGRGLTVKRGGDTFEDTRVLFADSSMLDLFSFPLARGDSDALNRPDGALLTAAAAQRFFGSAAAVGRPLTVEGPEGEATFTVGGVVEDLPATSSLQFDVLLPFQQLRFTLPGMMQAMAFDGWGVPYAHTFVQLADPVQKSALEEKIGALLAERSDQSRLGSLEEPKGADRTVRLQPLTALHLTPGIRGGLTETSSPLYSYVLMGLGLLLLAVACLNFATLSLGRSAGRAREVGVRKVVGATSGQVRVQFWGEALCAGTLAAVGALALARLALPGFNRLLQSGVQLNFFSDPLLGVALLGLTLAVALVAGAYPALALARLRPTEVLRGAATLGRRQRFTKALLTVQLAFTIGLLVATLVMTRQLDYLTSKDLGYETERLAFVEQAEGAASVRRIGESKKSLYERFRSAAAREPRITEVAGAFASLSAPQTSYLPLPLRLGDSVRVDAFANAVAPGYTEAMGIQVIAGRTFSPERRVAERGRAVLVNEAFARVMGDAAGNTSVVGRTLPLDESAPLSQLLEEAKIIGVVGDYHFRPLRDEITPLVLMPTEIFAPQAFAVRFGSEAAGEERALVERLWQEVAPGTSFELAFAEERADAAYRSEQRWRALVGWCAALALVIACLGVLGSAAYAAEQRRQEVAVRKALGASTASLVGLLSKGFLWPVALAFALAAPAAHFAMQRWLDTFAYRIDLGPGVFLLAGAATLLVALLTVSYQAVRAARANPTEALQDE